MAELKEILVIGGTGAQGAPVVKALSASGRYRVRVLTRSVKSSRAKQLGALQNVTLIQGAQNNQKDLHRAFKGVYGAWVNTDGFTLGEKDELFHGFRAYEIARGEGVQHYVWANIEYVLGIVDYDEAYHCGHMDGKGRIGRFILAQGQDGMKSSLFSTGPYMDMLLDGMFVPSEQPDGSFLWANPSHDVKLPLIALDDVGVYNLWLFDNPDEAAGLDLLVVTDNVSFPEIAKTFTEVTGKQGVFKSTPFEHYAKVAEPYPGAFVNWSLGPDAPRDESVMKWNDNFGAWWRYWGEGRTPLRDTAILDRIHPKRIRSLAEWMKHVGYDGNRRFVLKMVEDWAAKQGGQPKA
ncbi:NmrA-like family domain-containing protein 1 like [Verticillium longisporum]|uniref:NmrA-like family domain-containing protein 1 like n=1 Tax=Verticillium longisporum TaxID=100787 RepID=A0A8I3ALI5_VERLO|nr:NmrA-like family domain-containing protein 1 like [Verticillium longisporum]KAG7120827.1 NmrA-like family domain-containing protein 1 like [Verticillium longisporum]